MKQLLVNQAIPPLMSDVTHILARIESGDRIAADQLLPLVYDELRKLAAARMAQERPDHSLDATGLVHRSSNDIANNGGKLDRLIPRTRLQAAYGEGWKRP